MKRFIYLTGLIFIFSLFLTPAFANVPPPREQLKGTVDKITNILMDPSLKGDENKEKRVHLLCDAVYERFGLAKTAQLCLATYWGERTEAEKQEFTALFGKFLEKIYSSSADRYHGQQVAFIKEQVEKKKARIDARVVTDLIEIPVNIRMYQAEDGNWMVYDVVIMGVSMVWNYRVQFNHIIKQHSYEELIRIIKQKISE